MAVAFMPFPASLLGEYPDSQASIVLYGSNLVVANTFLALIWLYAGRAQLLLPNLSPKFKTFALRVTSAPILVYIVAIALSFINVRLSLVLFVAVPLFFITPHRLVAREVERAIAELEHMHPT
jgi:hypothetical protein